MITWKLFFKHAAKATVVNLLGCLFGILGGALGTVVGCQIGAILGSVLLGGFVTYGAEIHF